MADPLGWADDWIFSGSRFGFEDGDDVLLWFLAEMLHPAVRTDPAAVRDLRTFFNSALTHDGYELARIGDISGAAVFEGRRTGSGVRGSVKNLIVAAVGRKPEIVIDDAGSNDLRIVKNEQYCLIYDWRFGAHSLAWRDLVAWWGDRQHLTGLPVPWSVRWRGSGGSAGRRRRPGGVMACSGA